MKTQKVVRKSETLEDIVFEGRNKSYGAYDLERKRRRSLIIAFLISFVGFTTAIAIPFFDSL
jgi:protein TonB